MYKTAEELLLIVPESQRKEFAEQLDKLAAITGRSWKDLIAVLHFESLLNTKAKTPSGTYIGLNQIHKDNFANWIGNANTYLNSSYKNQMEKGVIPYFKMRINEYGKPKNIEDLYLYNLYPKAAKYTDENKHIETKQQQAKILYNSEGKLTKKSIREMFYKRYPFTMPAGTVFTPEKKK